ncbi:11693_t:CDS:2 [Ambispora gerdemannii]|uniref:Ornithine decarboxylase antizyme n=1 Tax=Ambispora gerdemannii TaxID=144530 RepID=A0A9N9C5Q4_9GLOM|nr:11693_t:CDS:2 [Ambispora gerdemannii]
MAGQINMIQLKDFNSSYPQSMSQSEEELLAVCLTQRPSQQQQQLNSNPSAIITLPVSIDATLRQGGAPDMTPELFMNTTQGLLAHKSGSFMGSSGGLNLSNSSTKGGSELFRTGIPSASIDMILTIVSAQPKSEYAWKGFVVNETLFLKGSGLENVDLRESIVAVLELAEECLKCRSLVVCLNKKDPQLTTLIRTFMYVGFEACAPQVFDHDTEKFMLVGMEL